MSDGYHVSPGHHKDEDRGHADFSVSYRVFRNLVPVCLIEIKPQTHWLVPSHRSKADAQIRGRADQLVWDLPSYIKTLYFLSCLGRKFHIYHYHIPTRCMKPALIVENGITLAPPEMWWCWDVLQPRGQQRLYKLAEMVQCLATRYIDEAPLGEFFDDDEDHDIIDPGSLHGSDFDDPLVSFFFSFYSARSQIYLVKGHPT
jgi:hypothetical protein